MASDFWEAYRDPRWQKKRLEVMEAAAFTCQECRTDEVTLNVHHRHYRKGAKPWEYHNADLVCLCEPCHKEATESLRRLKIMIGRLEPHYLQVASGFIKGLLLQQAKRNDNNHSISLTKDKEGTYYGEAEGIARAFEIIEDTMFGESIIVPELDDEGKIDTETLKRLAVKSRQSHGVKFAFDPDPSIPFAN